MSLKCSRTSSTRLSIPPPILHCHSCLSTAVKHELFTLLLCMLPQEDVGSLR